jgi:hypothetical protein
LGLLVLGRNINAQIDLQLVKLGLRAIALQLGHIILDVLLQLLQRLVRVNFDLKVQLLCQLKINAHCQSQPTMFLRALHLLCLLRLLLWLLDWGLMWLLHLLLGLDGLLGLHLLLRVLARVLLLLNHVLVVPSLLALRLGERLRRSPRVVHLLRLLALVS